MSRREFRLLVGLMLVILVLQVVEALGLDMPVLGMSFP
jgi:hypothetical protein